ncbi:MAG TPA: acyl-CoA-binding protein [Cytophagales bacterium]|nr:acyl-CoA-binding protein [Cytophagales bacterium]HAA17612.1 acyl-CoA-binding protein [Cytophagales bacterium]HAP63969.1 acyl-CoA-binding protein [Cytophagales bacterium]
MNIQEEFEEAIALSKTLTKNPGNAMLQKLYGLYKQATLGDYPHEKPAGFDMIAMAKHEGWKTQQGKPAQEAMREYIEIITQLKAQE